ncbi:MAG: electron transfer flavoprotein subunit alpha/FixB family protein [Myxococcota bacterium]|jgi:electron transfer flavoprotein alpha subunit
MGILIIAEAFKGKLKKATLSAITVGQQIAAKNGGAVEALLMGSGLAGAADELKLHGVAKVYVADAPALANYIAETYATVAAEVVKSSGAEYVFAAASAYTKDLLPRLASKFSAGMASEVCGLSFDGNKPLFARPVWAGNAIMHVTIESAVKFGTIRATEFAAAAAGAAGEVAAVNVTADPAASGVKYIEFAETKSERPELTEARVVISGGRGCKGPEGFKLLEQLADQLNAAIGASRAAVDSGWVPNDLQVGQTGKIVAPELYVACGLSGAIQHLAGMKGSKTIVAINKDPEAPIFTVADYGLVADMFKAVPELIDGVKAARG